MRLCGRSADPGAAPPLATPPSSAAAVPPDGPIDTDAINIEDDACVEDDAHAAVPKVVKGSNNSCGDTCMGSRGGDIPSRDPSGDEDDDEEEDDEDDDMKRSTASAMKGPADEAPLPLRDANPPPPPPPPPGMV